MICSRYFFLFVVLLGIGVTGCTTSVPTLLSTPVPMETLPPTSTPVPTLVPGDIQRTLMVDGVERSYLLHIPPGLDNTHPVAVVFAFHGADSQPAEMQASTGLDKVSDREGFLAIYPKGTERTWNAGSCCGAAQARNVDESAFIRQILDDIDTILPVETKRIYATGVSNGAALVYRLACEMPDTFAAVAPVAGALIFDPCTPSVPVSIIHIHGQRDDTVLYAGGGKLNTLPIKQLVANWAKLDGCNGTPQVEKQEKIIHATYASCSAGTAVELYTIEVGYHSWPSELLLAGSQVIWDFFAVHPKP